MNLFLEFAREAYAELECVTGDYEAKVPGLGVRFRLDVERACEGIVRYPFLWNERSGGWRRVNLPGFPYYIAYVIIDELILVLAVAHAARHPNYWKERLP
jgi:hypothetical protein